ncbi:MAG TPA: cupin domain-containing protein [Pyrinomonadaceae bacterium]|mgnify:CR=1 FL=1|nr:cupin domain-containing protein [Pyrinomonadaceae bacterium]
MKYLLTVLFVLAASAAAFSQARQPSTAKRPYVVKTKQQVSDIESALKAKPGNTNEDVVAAAGEQTRVAVFHDSKREGDLNEVHDGSDDIYYVLSGKATLMLGGTLVSPNEISPGEWRAKEATGGDKVEIKKGDLIFVPRGTRHQRTVTGKGFSMILIKIFADKQPGK